MSALPPKYKDLVEWVIAALDTIDGKKGKIVFDVFDGAVDASLITHDTELDSRGRKVKIETLAKTHLTIRDIVRA